MTRKTSCVSALFCLLSLFLLFDFSASAQKRKRSVKKKPLPLKTVRRIEAVTLSSGGIGSSAGIGTREPYLILEPCAKETTDQITALENAADKNEQVEILVSRIGNSDEWLRACSIYRLGEFRAAAQNALPVIIKLLRDEENGAVWKHVEDALWKIPPDSNIVLDNRVKMAFDGDVYQRLYGIYSLAYFKPIAGSHQSVKILDTLIETTKDEDLTVRWLSVMGIRQLGFYGINTSAAIPALSELIKNKKVNPVNAVRAFVPMGEKALPAAPLLFTILYAPEKYVENDEDSRSYSLYLTSAIALGRMGKSIIPLLEKEIEKQPFAILQVLRNISADETLPVLIKAIKHKNPNVRKEAIASIPNLTSIGAINMLPQLLSLINDLDPNVRNAAMSEIGDIAKYTNNKSPELQLLLKKRAVPALIKRLKDKEDSCYAALTIGNFGADAEAAIPALVKIAKQPTRNSCAEIGLYDIGEKGRKFLTAEQIKDVESSKNYKYDSDYNKAKPIKPKEQPKPSPPIKEGEG